MFFAGKTVDRFSSIAIYIGFGCLVLWAGIALINHSLESTFYKDYLLKWEVALSAYEKGSGSFPEFSGTSHVEYMDEVSRLMKTMGSPPPKSNTDRPFVYRLKKIGSPDEDILLFCKARMIVLYGISTDTFKNMDEYIDGEHEPEKGAFRGRLSKDKRTYVGIWMI
jgi:hypothetical protein